MSGSSKSLLLCRMQPYAIRYVLSPRQVSARIGTGAPPVANDNENMAHEEKSLDLASQALVFFYGRVCALQLTSDMLLRHRILTDIVCDIAFSARKRVLQLILV